MFLKELRDNAPNILLFQVNNLITVPNFVWAVVDLVLPVEAFLLFFLFLVTKLSVLALAEAALLDAEEKESADCDSEGTNGPGDYTDTGTGGESFPSSTDALGFDNALLSVGFTPASR